MTNKELERLKEMILSNNFDDIVLASQLFKNHFVWSQFVDENDKDFRVPKRYYEIMDILIAKCGYVYQSRTIKENRIRMMKHFMFNVEDLRTLWEINKHYAKF